MHVLNSNILLKYLGRVIHSTFPNLYIIVSLFIFLGCNKIESLPDIDASALVIESFVFEKKNNPHLKEDVVFMIDDHVISGQLNNYFFNSIPTFNSNAFQVFVNGVEQNSGKSSVDFRKPITYTLKSASGKVKEYEVEIEWDTKLAQIIVNTKGGSPITSKEDYLEADIIIDGQDQYSNLDIKGEIKGRGNSTWGFPKKPYKIKLESKQPVLGLKPEKSWVLLANYLDGTHLLNAVAMKIGQLLEMPFTNTIIPVELTVNNEYLGLYMLTEQIEVKTNRVDVDDEGMLLELDTNFDEKWQFKSKVFDLPVLVKFPEDVNGLNKAKNHFEMLEELIASDDFPNNSYLDYIDANSVANYLIVYMLTANREINHPKSTYIHKRSTGKFTMGPIWDFDWAFSYSHPNRHFVDYDSPLFIASSGKGTDFFSRFLEDPKIQVLLKEKWANFRAENFDDLLSYIEEYSFLIEGAKARDYEVWSKSGSDVKGLEEWLERRSTYMTTFINGL
jgi:hypothetical protein